MANASLLPEVQGVYEWHINSDEPVGRDYNDAIQDSGESSADLRQPYLYEANAYRSSDHDPVVIDLFGDESTPTPFLTETETPTPEVTETSTDTNTPGGPTETPTDTSTPDDSTETPTETPTSTDLPGTELIINGGFENLGSDGKPDVTPWVIKNATGDKAKCNKDKDGDGIPDKIFAHTGNCAFVFKGVAGEAGKIQQNLDLSGIVPAPGDTLNLSFFAQSKGGATVKAKVVFKYGDGTKTKITVVTNGSETYTEFTGSETLTSADVTKAKANVGTKSTSGKINVDDVSLRHLAGAGSTPEPTSTDTPAARLNGNN
jgi:hypothetical protein